MKENELSSARTITDPREAAALSNPMLRRVVSSFVKARSIGEVAASSGIELKRLHHHVTRLCRIGLLRVVGQRRRPGRAIKLYQASAGAFFVPFEVAPDLFTEGLWRELRHCIGAEHLRSRDGTILTLDGHGQPQMRHMSAGRFTGGAAELWRVLRLEVAEVEALRRDLKDVVDRSAARASGRGKPHLVHAAVALREIRAARRSSARP